MASRLPYLALCLMLAAAPGCRNYGPLFGPPGTITQQRQRASFYDPYVDVNAGPEVVGGRPRDFQVPLAEPVRSQPRSR